MQSDPGCEPLYCEYSGPGHAAWDPGCEPHSYFVLCIYSLPTNLAPPKRPLPDTYTSNFAK